MIEHLQKIQVIVDRMDKAGPLEKMGLVRSLAKETFLLLLDMAGRIAKLEARSNSGGNKLESNDNAASNPDDPGRKGSL